MEAGNERRQKDQQGVGGSLLCAQCIGSCKDGPVYRYLATRELLRQEALPGYEGQLPFPVMRLDMKRYKIFGIVTNRDLEGSTLDHLAP